VVLQFVTAPRFVTVLAFVTAPLKRAVLFEVIGALKVTGPVKAPPLFGM
jgi:hypothetical protein